MSAGITATPEAAGFASVAEKRTVNALLVFVFVLQFLCALHLGFRSDEPQHLHVVWGWAHGLLQYRDVFDNHTPLFHMLCAPVFAALGERAGIIVWMRLAMCPLFALSLWCVYRIGAALFSKRAGAWAAIFTGLLPQFLIVMTQFRTDDLWTAVWLLTVLVAVSGRFTKGRALAVGLLFGLGLGVSMKTSLLLLCSLAAAGIVVVLRWAGGEKPGVRALAGSVALACAGLVVVPAALTAFFAARGALRPFYYCVIQHNVLPAVARDAWHFSMRDVLFIGAILGLAAAASAVFFAAGEGNRDRGARRAFVLLAPGFYVAILRAYWPMVTPQDYPPFLAPLVVMLTPLLPGICDRLATWRAGARWLLYAIPLAVVATELTPTVIKKLPWRTRNNISIENFAQILAVSSPGDYVMDAKGETVFRPRPFYYALEDVTRKRMKHGLIADDIVPRLVATRTCLASEDRLEGDDLAFVEANYLPLTPRMRVAGKVLAQNAEAARDIRFTVAIPARYTIVAEQGAAAGLLDGTPFNGARFLDAGAHHFELSGGGGKIVLAWAQAAERGFNPFKPVKGDDD